MNQEPGRTVYYASASPATPGGGASQFIQPSGTGGGQTLYYSVDGSSQPLAGSTATTTQFFSQGQPTGHQVLYGQTSPQTVHMGGSPQVYTIGASAQQQQQHPDQQTYFIQGQTSAPQQLFYQAQPTRLQVGGQASQSQPPVVQYQTQGQPAAISYQGQPQRMVYQMSQQPQKQPQMIQAQASPQTEVMIQPVQANRPQQQIPSTTRVVQYQSPQVPASPTTGIIYETRTAQNAPAIVSNRQTQPLSSQGQTVTVAPHQAQPTMAAPYQVQSATAVPYQAQLPTGVSYQGQPAMAAPYQAQPAAGAPYQGSQYAQPVKAAPYQAQMISSGGASYQPQQQLPKAVSVGQTPTQAHPPYGGGGAPIDQKDHTGANQGPRMGYGQPMVGTSPSPAYQPVGGQPRGAQPQQRALQRPSKPYYPSGSPQRPTSPEYPPKLRQLQPRRSMDKGEEDGPPQFVQHPVPQVVVNDGESIVLKAVVRPAGDPSLTVQWLKNGTVLEASSRHNAILDRGYAEFQFLYTNETDSGEYVCIAKTDKGTAQSTSCAVTIVGDERVVTDSQLPEESMIMNLAAMESQLGNNGAPIRDDEKKFTEPPKFVRPLLAQLGLKENERAKFETFITPSNDPSLVVAWYKDGEPLKTGCRFTETLDRGYVILDIHYTYPEDSGEYMCIARNNAGVTQSNVVQLSCKPGNRIVTDSVLSSESVSYLQSLDSLQISTSQDHQFTESEHTPSAPVFELGPKSTVAIEGTPIRLLVKAGGYPHPKVQWLINGDVLPTSGGGGAWRIYNDGGISYLEFNRCGPPGEYTVVAVAKNNLGECSAECSLVIDPVPDFRPDLKHVAPDNPFRRMASLKKVERTDELNSAFSKSKPKVLELRKLERRSSATEGMNDTEMLYAQVQASLRSNRQAMPPQMQQQQQNQQFTMPPQKQPQVHQKPQPVQPRQPPPPPKPEPTTIQYGTANVVDDQRNGNYSVTETSAEFQLEL